ncbi:aminopeptidase P family protein [Citrobacter amalonaticus]|uniref:Aminopeptidase P family protein n=1 Tax=Citrobacter amalonaticus TaxID=35703 RepID=A0A2S4S2I1_CITAM|nr:aminopeptidase P family protein [Citrobacter amalonaticus]POT59475.1 aminopeptidase P family protein [Citrobacter amalonaticus]POT77605.1 aminopeptidase P family protein [Citrobacter amalonaticus]POU68057.1 aminopeptidase P family protein [Citrobacter amalonaticus]POV07661.1 aminopeptidase P family protein [Citrobacter amalonaticus]
MNNTTPLSALRSLLLAQGLDGMIVPRADAHQSEDCTPHDNKLAWLTGFSGSAGLALILRDRALIFVDGRYQVQVRAEVDLHDFEVHHLHDEPLADYLQEHVSAGSRIAFEPLLMVNSQYEALAATHCKLIALENDPFDEVWKDRPAAPCGPIREMPVDISGESSAQKRLRVAAELAKHRVDYLAITLPDNIAWLLNVRGSDLAMVPVPFSFALLHSTGELEWFVDSRKTESLSDTLLSTLTLSSPENFLPRCQQLANGKRFLVDKDYAPVALRFAIEQQGGNVVWSPDPITLMKANKNEIELAGYRECHEQDGAAWVNFLAWLAHEVPLREAAGNPVTELEAQAKQLAFRQQQPGFLEQSFGTISAAASNAAMCHYHSSEKTNTPITTQAMYLNDSGGQYENGTTDTTRTIAFAPQHAQRRLHYTAVLKGFLSLISLQFPSGSQGHQLDAFARRALWELGLDFDHGTGHGVGHQLLIHEQPHRIAKKVNQWPLTAGNIITIEPGYYLAGQYGIRIENQVEIIESRPGFCQFSSLTLVPIDLSLVELHLLSETEKQWIDDYHQQVRETLSPRVNSDARPWLFAATAPIRVQVN